MKLFLSEILGMVYEIPTRHCFFVVKVEEDKAVLISKIYHQIKGEFLRGVFGSKGKKNWGRRTYLEQWLVSWRGIQYKQPLFRAQKASLD